MRYVALVRGINVGGHKKFPKAAQLQLLERLGYSEIDIYIHTGNWIFTSNKSAHILQKEIEQEITKTYQWEVPVVIITELDFKEIVQQCPFSTDKRDQSCFAFFQKKLSKEKVDALRTISFSKEELIVNNRCVYLFFDKGAGKAKCSNNYLEKITQIPATSRNFRTVSALFKKL
ncbi:MAG: DUF1697 domain-containing protein [Flavobacteriaceae bacterium]|nr:DUF1697 domain-containing protein [Flavobacteriaceae bacterium]